MGKFAKLTHWQGPIVSLARRLTETNKPKVDPNAWKIGGGPFETDFGKRTRLPESGYDRVMREHRERTRNQQSGSR